MALQLAIARYRLPFARPFVTASATHTERSGLLVRIHDDRDGATGYGEVAPLPGHGGESLVAAEVALGRLDGELDRAVRPEGASRTRLSRWTRHATRHMAETPCARAGAELALADLLARREGIPLARWLAPRARRHVEVNATIGAVGPEEAAANAATAVAAGFRTLKVKVGDTGGTARLAAVRAAVGPAVRLRADANGAWDAGRASSEVAALARFDLELVEQPVPAGDVAGLAAARRSASMPIAADEALELRDGWRRVLLAGAADVLVLKPTLLGGPLAALSITRAARAAGVGVVVTTALDSAVGQMGALHVAAAIGRTAGACGLATGGFLAADVAAAPAPHRGRLTVPCTPGLGLVPTLDGDGTPLRWSTP